MIQAAFGIFIVAVIVSQVRVDPRQIARTKKAERRATNVRLLEPLKVTAKAEPLKVTARAKAESADAGSTGSGGGGAVCIAEGVAGGGAGGAQLGSGGGGAAAKAASDAPFRPRTTEELEAWRCVDAACDVNNVPGQQFKGND